MRSKSATATVNRVSLNLKCSECMHLNGTPAFEKVCSQLGKTSLSEACPGFTPEYSAMTFVKKGHLSLLATITAELSQKHIRLLAYSLRNVDFIKKAGFELGQEVVFSLGQDYLGCYVRGRIIGASRTSENLYIVSDFEGLNKNSALLTLMRDSVYSLDEFQKVRARLIAEGRIAEPKPVKGAVRRTLLQVLTMGVEERAVYRRKLASKPAEYVPPSLDTVPQKWLDTRNAEPATKNIGGRRAKNNAVEGNRFNVTKARYGDSDKRSARG